MAGLRVRVALDEARVADVLRGFTPTTLGDEFATTAAGVLACLGDMATLSFAPSVSGTLHRVGRGIMFCRV